MTVDSTKTKAIYEGNGSATVFPVPFGYSKTDDIKLTFTDSQNKEWDVASNFLIEVTESGDTRVVYPEIGDPIPTGTRLTVYRFTPLTQIVDLIYGGAFSPDVLEHDGFDRIVMQMQELQEEVDRSFKVSISNTAAPPTADEYLAEMGVKATQAENSATAASASADRAYEWANNPEDVQVTSGLFSAYHWAKKAESFILGLVEGATEVVQGIVRLATQAEAVAGTDDNTAMTPLKTKNALDRRVAASVASGTLLIPDGSGGWTPNSTPDVSGEFSFATDGVPVKIGSGVINTGVRKDGLMSGAVASRLALHNNNGSARFVVQLANGSTGASPNWVDGLIYDLTSRILYIRDSNNNWQQALHTGNGGIATTGGQQVWSPGVYNITVPKGHYAAHVICQAGGAGGSSMYNTAYSYGSAGGSSSFGNKVSAVGGSVAPYLSGDNMVPGARGVTYGSEWFHEPTPVNWSGKEPCDALYWNASGTINDWRPWGTGGLGKDKSANPSATTRLTAGGAGGYAVGVYSVTPGETITVTVGAGGAGGDRYGDGAANYKCPAGGSGYVVCVWL